VTVLLMLVVNGGGIKYNRVWHSFPPPGATQPIVGVCIFSPLSGFSLLAYEVT
jgi:hypothetical protein